MPLAFDGLQVLVLGNLEALDDEPLRVVVRPDGIQQSAAGDKASFRHRAFTEDDLAGERPHIVRVLVKVAPHAVNLYHLVDVPRNHPVIIPFSERSL